MAISWGSAVADATNAFRIGYEFSQSPATVVNGTTSVSVTEKIYLGTKYNAYDSGADWSISGSISASGSTSFNHTSGTAWSSSNVTLLASRTRTFAPSFSSTTTTSLSASVTGLAAIAGTATVSGSWTTAKRPVGAPAAPVMSGSTGATRFSDTQQNIAWTNTSPTSSSNPYVNVVVQRSTNGGSWSTIATLGVVTSYQDKTTSANNHYAYRVYATNGAGASSASGSSNTLYTTPRAPETPSAAKNASGNIVVAWTNASSQASQTEVYDNGVLLATLTGDPLSYTHTAPNTAVTHVYTLKYKVTPPALTGPASAASNTVQLQAPPNAPSNLTPMVAAIDGTEDVTLGWQHNPVDTTPQTKYEIQYRVNGGAWVSLGQTTTSTSSRLIAAGTWTNGTTVEWQVRTWGSHATASPWSASVVYNVTGRPIPTITTPTTATFGQSLVTAAWNYFDPAGSAQQGWEASLLDGGGGVLETISGSGTDSTVTFATTVKDGFSYSVRVRVVNGYGLWSTYATVTFPVVYFKPPQPVLTADWDLTTMALAIGIDNPPETGSQVPAISNELWRSIDGGPWTLVASNVSPDSSALDPIPVLRGTNSYFVRAFSATPSSIDSPVLVVPEPLSAALVLNAGPGWGISAVLPYDPEIGLSFSRERVLHQFSGRTHQTPSVGDSLNEPISISASVDERLPESPTWDELVFLCHAGALLACYRDPEGRRLFVSLSEPSLSGVGQGSKSKFTVNADRIDYDETTDTTDSSGLFLTVGLFLDEDGTPYFDPTRRSIVGLDVDGQPYIITGEG